MAMKVHVDSAGGTAGNAGVASAALPCETSRLARTFATHAAHSHLGLPIESFDSQPPKRLRCVWQLLQYRVPKDSSVFLVAARRKI